MNLPELDLASLSGLTGLGFVLIFFGLIVIFLAAGRRGSRRLLRPIPAFERLGHAIGLSVEAGRRLHLSLGRGGLTGIPAGSAFIGLTMLRRIAQVASISDRPPVATSGEGTLAILSRDTLRSAYQNLGAANLYDPVSGRLTGLTPFAYAAGTLPVIYDEEVNATVLAGNFGPEVALITDAAERTGGMTLAGSDSLPAQAVLYATAQEPLIGEELYAAGAYIQAGQTHLASLQAEDVLRVLVIAVTIVLGALKLLGVQ